MEKKVSSTGMYETTYSGGVFVGKLSMPTKTGLTDQTKVALLEYLTESDDFHKLVCDITGVERKQAKVDPELKKLKEDYSHVCDRYKQEQQKSNDLLHKWREETARRLDAERERDCAQKHHKFIVDEIFSMLKEVECSSVRGIVDELKAERANGKLLAEDNELCRRENDKLKLSYNKACEELKVIEKNMDSVSDNYDKLIEDYNCLITRYNNQKKYIAKYIEENKRLIDQVEKLKGRLNRAAKNYGELIKTISDKAMKSI